MIKVLKESNEFNEEYYQEISDFLESVESDSDAMELFFELEEENREYCPGIDDALDITREILGNDFIVITSEDDNELYDGDLDDFFEIYDILKSPKFYGASVKKIYDGGKSVGDRFLFNTPMGKIIMHETYCSFNWIAMSTKTCRNVAKHARELSN